MRQLHLVLPVVLALLAAPVLGQEPNFGRALAASESELFVGQPVNWYGPGTVYGYRLGAGGRWQERVRVVASDSSRMDDFGRALAFDGNTLVVGAPRKRGGVAYAFERASAGAAWRESAILEAPSAGQFGASLSLFQDDLLVGAPMADSTGAVHHYRRSGDNWTLRATLRPASRDGVTGFGHAMSRRGDWLLIGAPTSEGNAGRVYVSRRQSNGEWSDPVAVNLPRGTAPGGARLGTSVLIAGGRAYVSAPGAGAVYELEQDASGSWNPVGELRPFDSPRGAQFGFSMAMIGSELWVGAPSTNGGNGRVYRFLRADDGGWQGTLRFDADSADGTQWPLGFGYAIASAGGRAVVSMPSRDFGEGRVMVAAQSSGTWRETQQLTGEIHLIGGRAAEPGRCEGGKLGAFTCSNIELTSHVPVGGLGGDRGAWVNDVWGWTDPETQREIALVARRDGTSFVDLSNPSSPRLLGNLPRTVGSPPSVWRDIKVMNDHAYIVADGAGAHGVQVFDLTRLRGVRGTPVNFAPDTTYHEIHSAHNVVVDTTSGFLYVVGANSGGETCGGGLHIVDAREPRQLRFIGCYNDRAGANPRGYTHDAQCLVYRGPDTRYRGREICVGSNEREINIADVTDKANPVLIGRNSYPNVSYAHQGWFDDEQRYFYMNDEGDELDGVVDGTRTIVWDLSRLDDPVVAHQYIGPVKSSDHNLFVRGNLVFEANYGSGLRVLDITDRVRPREIGYFDSAPLNDDGPGHSAAQSGAWSNYPFFRSGIVVFTSVREGLFIVKVPDVPTS
jgi:choice-of-anchor B domain-containing protein